MFVESAAIGAAAALFRGGQLRNLSKIELRGFWLFVVAVSMQGIVQLGWLRNSSAGAVYALSFVILMLGLFFDRQYKGLRIVALGVLSNGLAVWLNGGKMPVLRNLVGYTHMPSGYGQFQTHSLSSMNSMLWFLGDIVKIWTPLQGLIVISIGDILMALGIIRLAYYSMLGSAIRAERDERST